MYEACLKAVRLIDNNASRSAIYSEVVKILSLPPEVLAVPQEGKHKLSKVQYRIGWTLWNLHLAEYLHRPARGRYSLTEKIKDYSSECRY